MNNPKTYSYPSQVQNDPMPRREDTGFDPPKPGEERLWPAQGDEPKPGEGMDKQVPQPDEPTPLSDERR
jgi:hypothetical protein